MPDISRRQFIAASGVTAASIWFAVEARELIAAGAHAAQAKRFEVLSEADAADIEAAAAQIIPSDGGTAGAREARVVYFMDRSLATFAKDQRPLFEKGAKELRTRAAKVKRGAKSFAALSNAEQIAVITEMEKAKAAGDPVWEMPTVDPAHLADLLWKMHSARRPQEATFPEVLFGR